MTVETCQNFSFLACIICQLLWNSITNKRLSIALERIRLLEERAALARGDR